MTGRYILNSDLTVEPEGKVVPGGTKLEYLGLSPNSPPRPARQLLAFKISTSQDSEGLVLELDVEKVTIDVGGSHG